jgi:hypothetical protein
VVNRVKPVKQGDRVLVFVIDPMPAESRTDEAGGLNAG